MLDTKSKSSKKFSFIMAAGLIAVTAVLLLAMYPVFEKNAAPFEQDVLQSENFLYELYQANCVLYKDIQEKVQEKAVSYADLYLQVMEQEYSGGNPGLETDELEDIGSKSWTQIATEEMEQLMDVWRTAMLSGLAREMDYCVIDHQSGASISNTGRSIKTLGTDQADEELASQYEYYVRISFDSAGNPEKVAVKGSEPDELLKAVQSVMKSEYLKKSFWANSNGQYRYDYYADGSFYYVMSERIWNAQTILQSTPRNTTFIYALTGEQKKALLSDWQDSDLVDNYRWEQLYAYYQAGTVQVVNVLIAVLGVIAFFLPKYKRYCLHRLSGVRLHIEVSLFVGCIYPFACSEAIMRFVNCTNRGYFDDIYSRYFSFVPAAAYLPLTVAINFLLLFVLLGGWYYLITTLGEIWEMGILRFVQERSLLRGLFLGIKNFSMGKWKAFKKEILHVDLGETASRTIRKLVLVNFVLLTAACMMWVFGWLALVLYSIGLYFGLKKYVGKIREQYKQLLGATRSIADGNLQAEFEGDWGVFESYKTELNKIRDGFGKAVEQEVKSQKMKTELITNVSHDLKTPLTAITTYTELLKDENLTPEQRREYVQVLEKKSLRLKYLIEDLFEVSKASSGNITLNPVDVDICNLIRQVYLEYEDRIEQAGLEFKFRMPEERVILQLDSQKTYRIFENLYTNIIKYAMQGTRVYVNVDKTEDGITIQMKNMSATELNIEPGALTERFVRGDSSRNTEGSGLGLAIVQNFVTLQNGKMEIGIDGDLFKVTISW